MPITIRPARPADATHLACFVDMASEGLALHLWETMRKPGQTLFEVGRSRAMREEGSFSYRNGHVAELDGNVAGALVGYRIAEVHDPNYRRGGDPNTPALPGFIQPLVELESMVPGHWYVNILATYPEYRGQGIGGALLAQAEVLATGARGMAVVVASENTAARGLYESAGYRQMATRPLVGLPGPHRGGDWVLMTKARTANGAS
jgi:ribosomal protein S18 acetylase RimI-like enzyme